MISHNGGDYKSPQSERSREIQRPQGPEDTIVSSTHELLDELSHAIEPSKSPILPPMPLRLAPSTSRKRDRDDWIATSSDAPLFSSDDLLSSSADNYVQKRRKRQHQRPWYEEEGPSNLANLNRARILKHSYEGDETIKSAAPHPRGPFKRSYDSGVWMGSDESTEYGDGDVISDKAMDQDVKEMETSDESEFADTVQERNEHDLPDGMPLFPRIPGTPHQQDKFTKAMQAVEDPGDFEGPIFPYWRRQPENLKEHHTLQKAALRKVMNCVERGEEGLDLSAMHLQLLRTPTLRPLRYFTKQISQQGKGNNFQPLTPDLGLYISNNSLDDVPSEVYHLVNLKVLSMRSNNLTEILPSISGLTNLKELNLGSNQLMWLPWELLGLIDPTSLLYIEKCTVHPNPFLKPVPSVRNIEDWKEPLHKLRKGHLASTRIAFLDIVGSSHRDYTPAPSSVTGHWEKSLDRTGSLYPPSQKRTKTPSLMELAMRACSKTTQLSQLPFLLPTDCPPHLKQLLQSTWKLKESGGQHCSVCGSEYIIPRTEWVEWWYFNSQPYNGMPLPLLRRGCSWQCFEENPNAVIRGWSTTAAPGDHDEISLLRSLGH